MSCLSGIPLHDAIAVRRRVLTALATFGAMLAFGPCVVSAGDLYTRLIYDPTPVEKLYPHAEQAAVPSLEVGAETRGRVSRKSGRTEAMESYVERTFGSIQGDFVGRVAEARLLQEGSASDTSIEIVGPDGKEAALRKSRAIALNMDRLRKAFRELSDEIGGRQAMGLIAADYMSVPDYAYTARGLPEMTSSVDTGERTADALSLRVTNVALREGHEPTVRNVEDLAKLSRGVAMAFAGRTVGGKETGGTAFGRMPGLVPVDDATSPPLPSITPFDIPSLEELRRRGKRVEAALAPSPIPFPVPRPN